MRTAVVISALVALCGVARAELTDPREDEPYVAMGYRHGRPIKLQLITIDWADVEIRTARAFRAMQRAAAADGIELFIRSGFRSYEQQSWLYQAWRAGYGNKAARPGHSNHQSGRALDLVVRDPATLAWLTARAKRFGFRRTVKSEPWHWELTAPPKRAARRR